MNHPNDAAGDANRRKRDDGPPADVADRRVPLPERARYPLLATLHSAVQRNALKHGLDEWLQAWNEIPNSEKDCMEESIKEAFPWQRAEEKTTFKAIGYYHRGKVMWEPLLLPVEDGLIYVTAVQQSSGPERP